MTVTTEAKVADEPKTTQAHDATNSPSTPPSSEKQEIVAEDRNERNWKQFREERKKEREEKEQAERKAIAAAKEAAALKAALEAVVNKPHIPEQDISDLSEDDRISRLVEEKMQLVEKRREAANAKREAEEMPSRLNEACPGFNEVCSDENIDYLQFKYPEIYAVFKEAPDSFTKWKNAYHTIKKLVPNYDSKKDEKRIDQNMKKPQSISVPGLTPHGDVAPHKLDDQRRSDNWKRMQRVMKGVK